MKFQEMKYERPDLEKEIQKFNEILDRMESAKEEEEFFGSMEEFYELGRYIETMFTIANIRNSINTQDEFYEKEVEFINENGPKIAEVFTRLANIRLTSKFRTQLEERYGSYITAQDEIAKKVFKPEIIEDLTLENKLSTEYDKLLASAQIDFEGEKRNLSQMAPFQQSMDREMRRKACYATNDWFTEKKDEFDRIYDDLVKVRHRIAQKLGFKNHMELAYLRMGRVDWNFEDARIYRKQILESVVPLTQKYYKEQMKRIKIDDPKYYDYPLMYLTGNPTPKGEEKELVDAAQKMYRELSKETGDFFDMMVNNSLMDLSAKKGKANGGYCTSLPLYKMPFIFSNFNGTSGDVDVLTHEAGHAFQGYMSKDIYPDDLKRTTSETAEIHSMSMEFFTHPWMESFFGDDTQKYYHSHVLSALNFLPYGASVDEFQEWVYLHPEATPDERHQAYRNIEKKYLPHIDYADAKYLENGGRWQRQLHIYVAPFYYLDYTIAQVCAFQFFVRDLKNHEEAWKDYVKLCSLGGTKPFTELIKEVNIKNPFTEGTIGEITPELEKYLDGLDKNKIK